MAKNPFGGGSDEEVMRASGDLLSTLGKDPSILDAIFTLLPNHQKIQSSRQRYLNVFNDFVSGDHEKEGELQAARHEVSNQVAMFRALAVLTGSQDPTIPQRLGMAQPQPATKRTTSHLTSPENFRMVYEGHTILARASAVKGARSYEVWGCEGDPMSESNWRHLTTSGRVNRIEVTGLTPGKVYYFRIRAISSTGPGPWSNFISMMAI